MKSQKKKNITGKSIKCTSLHKLVDVTLFQRLLHSAIWENGFSQCQRAHPLLQNATSHRVIVLAIFHGSMREREEINRNNKENNIRIITYAIVITMYNDLLILSVDAYLPFNRNMSPLLQSLYI